MRAYTAPPMHSGYSRYDRYFMAFGKKTHDRHHSLSTLASRSCTASSDVADLTSVSYSSVLLSDSSNFPYCFHTVGEKTKSSQRRGARFAKDGVAVPSNTPGMSACLLSRKSES